MTKTFHNTRRSYAIQELKPFVTKEDIANCATAHNITVERVHELLAGNDYCTLTSEVSAYLREAVINRQHGDTVQDHHNANFE